MECSLADISHQLKTPLTSLEILNAALSQENMEEEQRTRLLQEQRMLLSRMEWLIAVLLKLSRLDAGTIKFENDSFPVRELVERATEAFAITLDIRNITLDLSEVQDIQMYGDQRWLAEAISNIVKNCMESTPVGGCVKLRAEENAMYVKLTIMDNGSGIPREDIPHLFERFYRGANSAKTVWVLAYLWRKQLWISKMGRLLWKIKYHTEQNSYFAFTRGLHEVQSPFSKPCVRRKLSAAGFAGDIFVMKE